MRLTAAEFERMNRAAEECVFGGVLSVVATGEPADPAEAVYRRLTAAGVAAWHAEALRVAGVLDDLTDEYGPEAATAFLLGSCGKVASGPCP